MQLISFIDHVFSQFTPHNWRMGVAIYRSGGINSLQIYNDLVSAKIKAGIGERYEVRVKLHPVKCVQWLECTCQAYRRRGEKCAHIAAFCLFLDQDKPEVLRKFSLGAGNSDRYLIGNIVEQQDKDANNELYTGVASGNIESVIPRMKVATVPIESFWRTAGVNKIVVIDVSAELPFINVTVLVENNKNLTYSLGIDDAIKLITHDEYKEYVSKRLLDLYKPHFKSKRFFQVNKHGLSINIEKSVQINTDEKEFDVCLSKVRLKSFGKTAIYIDNIGFIPFSDSLNVNQLVRWEEYPNSALLDMDVAAALFQSNFERMRETADVKLEEVLLQKKVVEKLSFDELNVKQSGDGYFLVDAKLDHLLSPPEAPSKGKKVPQNNFLLSLIQARLDGKKFIPTKDGWMKVSEDIDWLKEKITQDGSVKLSTMELIKFREQFAENSEIIGNQDTVKRIKNGLISFKELDSPLIENTNLSLRPYQEDGLKWLWWLYQNGLGGLLCDEMGLGKTHQAMALIAGIANTKKGKVSLVVCPTTVIDHWMDKLKRFVPNLNVVCYHGLQRKSEDIKPGNIHKVLVTSYGILLRDVALFQQLPLALIVLDEAHLVKNQTTRTYRAALKIPSEMRLCLTGTPLENDLMELKNLFDYILPTYLGSDAEFKKKYQNPAVTDPMRDLELQRLIHPFKMRRNKIDVLLDLPEKVEDLRYCYLNSEQKKLYDDALALKGAQLVEAIMEDQAPVPYVHIFSIITLLKQICDDPALIDSKYEEVCSGKLHLFDEILEEALESDQKVVVFSQYAKMIDRLAIRLGNKGIKHVKLTGTSTKRGDIVREFQENNEVKVFLGSLLAGGTGIDLTAASVVIHFDRWWNAAKENQASDRVHRIGQNKNVQIIKLITRGTLEERIDEIINRKKNIFERFVEQDKDVFKHLTREDLLNLLAPVDEKATAELAEPENVEPEILEMFDTNYNEFTKI